MFNLPIGLRTKVAILSLFLLCLPWLGYQYVWEMEKYLRHGQEKTLEGTTQALATALHERPKLFNNQASFLTQVKKGRDLYAYPLSGPIRLDGKRKDWQAYWHKALEYGESNQLYKRDPNQPLTVHFTHMVGKYAGYLYAFFEVRDPHVIYRGNNTLSIDKNDHLAIATLAPDGQFKRYIVSTMKDGWISAFKLPNDPKQTTPVVPEIKIQGQWRKTAQGYNIELRLPLAMVGSKLGFAIYDVNDANTKQLDAIVGTSAIDDVNKLGTVLVPSPEIEQIIKGMGHNHSRIWVLDNHGRVLARSGNLHDNQNNWARSFTKKPDQNLWQHLKQQYLHPLYSKILITPPKDFIDTLQDSTLLEGSYISTALTGQQGSGWRLTPDKKAVVLAAASPIWIDNNVMGVVVAEETTHGIRTLRNKALEQLFDMIITVMGMGTIALFIFASSISSRIRRLRDDAEQAIDSQGRITRHIIASSNRDEIGDLSRSLANIVSRLSQYNHYLENMSSRLSHELRTPVAVVRSSLEHLSLQPLAPTANKYVIRAQEGVNRLSMILNNMSEATRLEESIAQAETEIFPLSDVISGCIQGYQLTYPQHQFTLTMPSHAIFITGVPEYIAQLMDKLIANALEFSASNHPIAISIDTVDPTKSEPLEKGKSDRSKQIQISVFNQGPPLPDNMAEQIFESMVSVRHPEYLPPNTSQHHDKPHLGLGLYIARLITHFHHGHILAQDHTQVKTQQKGVEIQVKLPITEPIS
ncbi:proteobacterial dedicated sortase system histidine kinase [Shewanella surugensis]|uniref:histidine kinase n=1 Tax=Shewanella surugensis TaxID=212020 RepID=A0ABT0LE83_9GAMM|nr:proteobacterial dedicated sortase system histidine kinase [Shewanella surugensis]MCL1126016.1 proteobacterial dedicated sortase system histidine kinase [Shewanella surugensis]